MHCCWVTCNENKWHATGSSLYLTELHNCPAVLRSQAYGSQRLIKERTLINMYLFQYVAQLTWSVVTETTFIPTSTVFTVSFATFQPVSCTSNFLWGWQFLRDSWGWKVPPFFLCKLLLNLDLKAVISKAFWWTGKEFTEIYRTFSINDSLSIKLTLEAKQQKIPKPTTDL